MQREWEKPAGRGLKCNRGEEGVKGERKEEKGKAERGS